jgi:hypothetical protein
MTPTERLQQAEAECQSLHQWVRRLSWLTAGLLCGLVLMVISVFSNGANVSNHEARLRALESKDRQAEAAPGGMTIRDSGGRVSEVKSITPQPDSSKPIEDLTFDELIDELAASYHTERRPIIQATRALLDACPEPKTSMQTMEQGAIWLARNSRLSDPTKRSYDQFCKVYLACRKNGLPHQYAIKFLDEMGKF